MKKNYFYILMIAAMAVNMACDNKEKDKDPNEPPDGASFAENYVQGYIIVDEFELKVFEPGLYVSLKGNTIGFLLDDDFKQYSTLYNDISYNKKKVPYSDIAVGDWFTSITAVCDKEIYEGYTAGTPLNDKLKFVGETYYPFIKSGYSSEVSAISTIEKPLNEITAEDLKMIKSDFSLLFIEKPDITLGEEHTFTVTIENTDKKLSEEFIYW